MNDEYLVTKETAEEMKESFKVTNESLSHLSLYLVEGDHSYDEDFLEIINEGLDNGVNMSPFLKLNEVDKPVLSINHAKTYIQAVKDGNEDIAMNVSTILKKVEHKPNFSITTYEPLFSQNYLILVDKMREIAKTLDEPGKFDVLLSTDERGFPAYTLDHIRKLYPLVKETKNINVDALLEKGNNGKCLYNEMQMDYLIDAVKEGISVEHLTEIRKKIEDNNHDTSYGSLDMYKVEKAMEEKFNEMMNQKRNIKEVQIMDDKFFVTKETAEKMKESLREFISKLEKENEYYYFREDFLEAINEGLDNGVNMSPFLKLDSNNEQIFSANHAKTYIQAVKDGNEDIAKNVSTALEIDDGYSDFEPLFSWEYLRLVNEMRETAKTLGEPGKFDVLLSTDENGLPAYKMYHIRELYPLVKENHNINIDALLEKGNNGKCLYDEMQMNYLIAAVKDGLPVEPFVEIRKSIEDNNHDTSYGSADMNRVEKKMEGKFYEMESQKRDMERGDER